MEVGGRDQERLTTRAARKEDSRVGSVVTTISVSLVRLVGVFLVMVGVWAGVKVILEAWSFYNEPSKIERFAFALERSAGLGNITAKRGTRAQGGHSGVGPGEANEKPTPGPRQARSVRVSYLLAWPLVILLLLLIGKLASWAMHAGMQMAVPTDRR